MIEKAPIINTDSLTCHDTVTGWLMAQRDADDQHYREQGEGELRKERQRLLDYLKSLQRSNPKASLAATIDLIETTDLEKGNLELEAENILLKEQINVKDTTP